MTDATIAKRERDELKRLRNNVTRLANAGDPSVAVFVLGRSVDRATAEKVLKLQAALVQVNTRTGIVRAGETLDDSSVFLEASRAANLPTSFAASLTIEERKRMRELVP